jgi:hypothetical protein
METALVAARKATPKGDFRIALARLTVSKTRNVEPQFLSLRHLPLRPFDKILIR